MDTLDYPALDAYRRLSLMLAGIAASHRHHVASARLMDDAWLALALPSVLLWMARGGR